MVAWPAARHYLGLLASKHYKLAATAATEFARGEHAGQAKMAESLLNLPEALQFLLEEDERARTNVQG